LIENLLVVQAEGLGAAYGLVADLETKTSCELLEFVGGVSGATLLMNVADSQQETVKAQMAAQSSSWALIKKVRPEVINAIYSLSVQSLNQGLLILESTSSVDLIKTANHWVEGGALMIDIKIPRANKAQGFVIATGAGEVLSRLEKDKGPGSLVTLIEKPSASFERLFGFTEKTLNS
jgi:hypothetical protein